METYQHQNESTQPISMRCPECLKAYQVDSSAINDEKPTFQCQDCESLFWFPYTKAIGKPEFIAFPMNWNEEDLDLIFYNDDLNHTAPSQQAEAAENDEVNFQDTTESVSSEAGIEKQQDERKAQFSIQPSESVNTCPKCNFEYIGQQTECDSCGVIFEKYHKAQKDFDGAPEEIQKLWTSVLEAYDQVSLHQDFVDACTKSKHLEFAAKKYRQVLEANPTDDIAQAMQKQISALTTVIEGAQVADQIPEKMNSRKSPKFNITLIILFLGGLVIGTGYLVHPLRNLMGVGVAMIFLTLALRVYFRKN